MLWAAGLGASTGALWAVHNRMVAAVAITVAGAALARGAAPAPARAGRHRILVIAAAVLGTHVLDSYLIDHSYGGAATGEVSNRFDELFAVSGLRTAAANLLGQTWYLLVATFGLRPSSSRISSSACGAAAPRPLPPPSIQRRRSASSSPSPAPCCSSRPAPSRNELAPTCSSMAATPRWSRRR